MSNMLRPTWKPPAFLSFLSSAVERITAITAITPLPYYLWSLRPVISRTIKELRLSRGTLGRHVPPAAEECAETAAPVGPNNCTLRLALHFQRRHAAPANGSRGDPRPRRQTLSAIHAVLLRGHGGSLALLGKRRESVVDYHGENRPRRGDRRSSPGDELQRDYARGTNDFRRRLLERDSLVCAVRPSRAGEAHDDTAVDGDSSGLRRPGRHGPRDGRPRARCGERHAACGCRVCYARDDVRPERESNE
mmetsp:Transcript_27210/g.64626  ORF Transcript_27210/g.64626 Transcript_27210/m.64626 type:complete len:249 (+) Transcript_27210:98-844(+)